MSKSAESSNKGLTLLEVLVAVAILGLGIVFVFRAFFSVLEAEKRSQNIMESYFLAEDYLWQIEVSLRNNTKVNLPGGSYEIIDLEIPGLKELDFGLIKGKSSINLKSYLYKGL